MNPIKINDPSFMKGTQVITIAKPASGSSIYSNLELMKMVAINRAKAHGCNYNVILMNPNHKGEFDESVGSTYEMVADTYFQKERPNVKLLFKTDDLI